MLEDKHFVKQRRDNTLTLNTIDYDFKCGDINDSPYEYKFLSIIEIDGVAGLKKYILGLSTFACPGEFRVTIHHMNGDLSILSGFSTDIYNLVAVEKQPKEVWVPILCKIHPKSEPISNSPALVASHFLAPSEKEALKYNASNGWKVSHAVKVWPKD